MVWEESESMEFKSSLGEWKEIVHALCGFANASGGTVAVGIDDAGVPTGLEIGKGAIEDLLNKIRLNTDPALYPSVSVRMFGPDRYMELRVERSETKPVFAFERAYVRVGRTTQKLSATAVREMVIRFGPVRFDEAALPIPRRSFVVSRALGKRNDVERIVADKAFWKHGKPTAALALSVGESVAGHPQAAIQAALFKGADMSRFLDMKEFGAPLLLALEDATDFVRKHLDMGVVLDGSPRRKEVWSVPLPAVREALVNAVVHRDYRDPGRVQIRIFSDRLEIWSPGLLPSDLPLETVRVLGRSIPRNPVLARLFQMAGVIESFGTGFQRLEGACADAGNPAPEYFEAAGAFVVRFPFPSKTTLRARTGQVAGQDAGQDAGQVAGQDAAGPPAEIQRLLAVLRNPMSRSEIQRTLGLASRAHFEEHYLRPALEAGWIVRTLPDKPQSRFQKYRIADPGFQKYRIADPG